MPVLSGRLKAVVIALLATIMLVRHRTRHHPGRRPARSGPLHVRRRQGRIRRQLHRSQRDLGRVRQVPDHAVQLAGLGGPVPRRLRRAADAGQPGERGHRQDQGPVPWLGSWRRVAYWWLTGSGRTTRLVTFATQLRDQGHALLRSRRDRRRRARPPRRNGSSRFSETSGSIDYTGAWRRPATRGYAGDAVRVHDRGRRERHVHVHRAAGHLVRPGRPDPRQGEGLDRRRAVKTVDLHRRLFTRPHGVFSKSWTTAGRHTLTIEVVGTQGHPIVAIDELVGRRSDAGRQRAAITSISIRKSAARAVTPTVALVGGSVGKYSR